MQVVGFAALWAIIGAAIALTTILVVSLREDAARERAARASRDFQRQIEGVVRGCVGSALEREVEPIRNRIADVEARVSAIEVWAGTGDACRG